MRISLKPKELFPTKLPITPDTSNIATPAAKMPRKVVFKKKKKKESTPPDSPQSSKRGGIEKGVVSPKGSPSKIVKKTGAARAKKNVPTHAAKDGPIHHCWRCKAVPSPRCFRQGHLYRCAKHGSNFSRGSRCRGCKQEEEEAAKNAREAAAARMAAKK